MSNLNAKWNLRIPKEILDIIKENVNNGKFNNISDGLRYYLKEGISIEKTVSDIANEISNEYTLILAYFLKGRAEGAEILSLYFLI